MEAKPTINLSSASPAKLNINALKNSIMNQAKAGFDETISIEGIVVPITKEAMTELIDPFSMKIKTILKIGSGVAIIKNYDSIGSSEINQAIEMEGSGYYNYLPVERWG